MSDNKLTFDNEDALLNHPSVLKVIDEKVSAAEQDTYDKDAKLKDMIVSQLITIGIETDSFITKSIKDSVEKGDDESIVSEYDSIKNRLNGRSLDSLCDTLSDLNEAYMTKLRNAKSVNSKLQDAIDKDPNVKDNDQVDGKDNKDNKQGDNDNNDNDNDNADNKNNENGTKNQDGEEINNPDNKPDEGNADNTSNAQADPFGKVVSK